MKIEDVLKNHAEANPSKPSLRSYRKRWMNNVHGCYGIAAPLGQKELGQLKLIVQRLELKGLPALDTLDSVVLNWNAFAAFTTQTKRLPWAPSRPSIGFVLQHVDILIDYPIENDDTA